MITDKSAENLLTVPFVFRFAQRMMDIPYHALRYDTARQISEVLVNGRWVDSPDAFAELTASTRVTKVQRETTDDE
jgi:hypothetical protein